MSDYMRPCALLFCTYNGVLPEVLRRSLSWLEGVRV